MATGPGDRDVREDVGSEPRGYSPVAHDREDGTRVMRAGRGRGQLAVSGPGNVPVRADGSVAPVDVLAQVAAEDVWLKGLRSERTRHAYKIDVEDFVATLDIRDRSEFYRVTPAAVMAWNASLESRGLKAATVRRKLSSLSSLFRHLVKEHVIEFNPVREVKRPTVNREKGRTAAFSQDQARAILDAPPADTLLGLRDRAILSVGMQLGPRRAEIARLIIEDLHMHNGLWCMRLLRKGGKEAREVMNPQTERRIRAYLDTAGHGGDLEGPLFRPVRSNQVAGTDDMRRHMDPKAVDRVLRKWCAQALGLTHGFSAHSMRATFATIALTNGAKLENVQKAMGHADPSTTKLYDHRGDNPEEAAAFFANY